MNSGTKHYSPPQSMCIVFLFRKSRKKRGTFEIGLNIHFCGFCDSRHIVMICVHNSEFPLNGELTLNYCNCLVRAVEVVVVESPELGVS